MHLTDDQLNEYLDEVTTERAYIEAHLSSCDECAARLSTLQNVFTELDSLPELELTRNLAASFTLRPSLPAQLPKFLTLTVSLQAAVALTAIILAVPFVANLLPVIEMPSLVEISVQVQSQWTAWLDTLATFQFPTMPELPIMEMSSLLITFAGVSVLWILGNGLLLRNQR
jgi:anti-sigma factor RsiW